MWGERRYSSRTLRGRWRAPSTCSRQRSLPQLQGKHSAMSHSVEGKKNVISSPGRICLKLMIRMATVSKEDVGIATVIDELEEGWLEDSVLSLRDLDGQLGRTGQD